MLEFPCTQVGGQTDGRTRATFTSCMSLAQRGSTIGKTRATITLYKICTSGTPSICHLCVDKGGDGRGVKAV